MLRKLHRFFCFVFFLLPQEFCMTSMHPSCDVIKPSFPDCLGCQSHNHSQPLNYGSSFLFKYPGCGLHSSMLPLKKKKYLGVESLFTTPKHMLENVLSYALHLLVALSTQGLAHNRYSINNLLN